MHHQPSQNWNRYAPLCKENIASKSGGVNRFVVSGLPIIPAERPLSTDSAELIDYVKNIVKEEVNSPDEE